MTLPLLNLPPPQIPQSSPSPRCSGQRYARGRYCIHKKSFHSPSPLPQSVSARLHGPMCRPLDPSCRSPPLAVVAGAPSAGVTSDSDNKHTTVERYRLLVAPGLCKLTFITWWCSLLFDRLRKENPGVLKKLVAVEGDLTAQDLGLRPDQKQVLTQEVSVVINGAASLRLEWGLKAAVESNTLGTLRVLELAAQMSKLEPVQFRELSSGLDSDSS
ncbi:hypothetical protein J6590_090140 [Homalodisca vitripennis]|nr:hypothetical protein J6590_090140 [Homalodisca vitripennis]